MADVIDSISLESNVWHSPFFLQEQDKLSSLLVSMRRSSLSSRATPWLFANMPLCVHGWDTPDRPQGVNFLFCSLKMQERHLSPLFTSIHISMLVEDTEDQIIHFTLAWQKSWSYQKVISNWPESLQESLCLKLSQGYCQKQACSWYIPTWHRYSQQKCHFPLPFFCLRSVQGQRCNRQKHWIPWGKGDKIIARRKAQVYTSPEKLKHMLNFNFLMLKFPLMRRPANKQSYLLQLYKCCIPTVSYCQEIKWNY